MSLKRLTYLSAVILTAMLASAVWVLPQSHAGTLRVDFSGTAIYGDSSYPGTHLLGNPYSGYFTFDESLITSTSGLLVLNNPAYLTNGGYETALSFYLTGMSGSFNEASASLWTLSFLDGSLYTWSIGGEVGTPAGGDQANGIGNWAHPGYIDFTLSNSPPNYYVDGNLAYPKSGGLSVPTWTVTQQTTVPVPATMLLLISGLAGLAVLKKRPMGKRL